MYKNDNELFEALKKADKKALEQAYLNNESVFKGYISKKYNALSNNDIEDIYHDTIIVLALFATDEKNTNKTLKSSISTFLIGIGKNILSNRKKYNDKERLYKELAHSAQETSVQFFMDDDSFQSHKRKKAIAECLNTMGKKCRELLNLIYEDNFDLDELLQITDYKNREAVKSAKSRCLRRLKECVKMKINP